MNETARELPVSAAILRDPPFQILTEDKVSIAAAIAVRVFLLSSVNSVSHSAFLSANSAFRHSNTAPLISRSPFLRCSSATLASVFILSLSYFSCAAVSQAAICSRS